VNTPPSLRRVWTRRLIEPHEHCLLTDELVGCYGYSRKKTLWNGQ